MRFREPFLKLPIRLDAEALAREVRALPPDAWDPHPSGFIGNEAVKLVTRGGELTDLAEGAMGPTIHLQRCPYVREIMGEIGAVWGRSRFMGLAAGSQVPPHVDIHYYWRTHLRIHIPVVTNPGVQFTCGGETVHMAAGECWVFDSFRKHDVQNKGAERRVHLVIDTVGGGAMPELIRAAQAGSNEARLISPGAGRGDDLSFEQFNSPEIMSPWEMRCHFAYLLEEVRQHPSVGVVAAEMDVFADRWAAAWARFGTGREGDATYLSLLRGFIERLGHIGGEPVRLKNDVKLFAALDSMVIKMAVRRPANAAPSPQRPH